MKKISFIEYQGLLLDMLSYITDICEKNNINYSLIGGSLIGAIREKKILAWDDDIDIILTSDNYKKLVKAIIDDNNERYILLNNDIDSDYPFPFSKLIDTKTTILQKNQIKINNYGAFIDIFSYHNVPNNKLLKYFYFKKIDFLKKMINGLLVNEEFEKEQSFIKKMRNLISKKIGAKKLILSYNKILGKYDNHDDCTYIASNWRAYDLKKELQYKKNMTNYEFVEFSNLKVMVSSNYDDILKTTFGNYMIPPSGSKKINHEINAFWRNDDEKIKK